ncbi:hypothetical protein ACP70R_003035 [Stipagrostis hirtigluma subsp. patula]
MAAAQLLAASCIRQLSRSASGTVAKVGRGFNVFRIDGYSWTKALPGGERISSDPFVVGGRHWYIDYYPNGTDASVDDSDDIALYLRLHNGYNAERVRAQYKFGLLDAAGVDAYELSPETGIFTCPGRHSQEPEGLGCGYAAFIAKEELERRRESLLQDDCLAIRCDVAVPELSALAVAPKENYSNRHDDSDDSDWEGTRERTQRRRPRPPPDDREYVRRCLAKHRR